MKTEAGDVTLIAVGGGAFLIPDRLPGVSRVIRVEHGDCANAVGAAIAQVSRRVRPGLQRPDPRGRDHGGAGLASARGRGRRRPATLAVIETEDIPIAYLPGNAVRIRVRVGDVAGR